MSSYMHVRSRDVKICNKPWPLLLAGLLIFVSLSLRVHARSEGYCTCPMYMYVCLSVHSFLPPYALDPEIYVHTCSSDIGKNFYNCDFHF